MNISEQEQDIVRQDSSVHKPDSSVHKQIVQADSAVIMYSLPVKKREISLIVKEPELTDTVSVCERSHISDITFIDPTNIISRINRDIINGFPARFIEKNRNREVESREILVKSLRDGEKVKERLFHEDWIIFLVLIASFFYASLPVYSRKLFPGATRFFLFRGIGDPESRETSELFHWQSTVFNLITFINLALFAYFAASYNSLLPVGISGFALWTITLVIVIASITLRHISCVALGWMSDSKEVWDEYIITIFQTYRYLAFACFIMVVSLAYSTILPPKTFFLAGYIVFAVLYFMRITRLFFIFLKRNVSILYLILYLCALEFLPVAVLIKYVTGLF
jgi:magnesium-transporting ATPase (P-type)